MHDRADGRRRWEVFRRHSGRAGREGAEETAGVVPEGGRVTAGAEQEQRLRALCAEFARHRRPPLEQAGACLRDPQCRRLVNLR